MLLKKLHRFSDVYTKCERNPRKVGRKWSMHRCENDILQMEDEKQNLLQTLTLPAIFGKALQTVTPFNHKVKDFWVALTLYFVGQGINYRTVATQFGVAVRRCFVSFTKKQKSLLISWPPNASNSLKVIFKENIFPLTLELLRGATLWYLTPRRMRN